MMRTVVYSGVRHQYDSKNTKNIALASTFSTSQQSNDIPYTTEKRKVRILEAVFQPLQANLSINATVTFFEILTHRQSQCNFLYAWKAAKSKANH